MQAVAPTVAACVGQQILVGSRSRQWLWCAGSRPYCGCMRRQQILVGIGSRSWSAQGPGK